MAHPLFVLNGSNLNMLGKREPHLYGTTTLAQVKADTERLAESLGLACEFRQTNHEGVMVDWLHEAFEKDAAVVIIPAGFSFGSFVQTHLAQRAAAHQLHGDVVPPVDLVELEDVDDVGVVEAGGEARLLDHRRPQLG